MSRYSLLVGNLIVLTLLVGCSSTSSSGAPRPTPAISAPLSTAGPASASPPATASSPTNTGSPTATTPNVVPSGAPAPPKIALKLITKALDEPVYVTHAGDGSGRLFVVEKRGLILLLRNGA